MPHDIPDLQLPCGRETVSNIAPTILSIWDIVTSGLISYWVVVKILGQVKNAKDPQDDKIHISDI